MSRTKPLPKTELGRLIRATRESLGLTLTAFAKQLGVTHPNICHWEAGRVRPPMLKALNMGALAQGELRKEWVEMLRARLRSESLRAFMAEVAE